MSGNCLFYRLLIDPILQPVRQAVTTRVPADCRFLEVACGTGDQSLALSKQCRSIVGVDQNSTMVRCAASRLRKGVHDHMEFRQGDGRNLPFAEYEFDCASISLALHEMPPEHRLPVLKEMIRTARTLIIADYASPLPPGLPGKIVCVIERLAGGDHYGGFKNYQAAGGLSPLLSGSGLIVESETAVLGGSVRILTCRLGAG